MGIEAAHSMKRRVNHPHLYLPPSQGEEVQNARSRILTAKNPRQSRNQSSKPYFTAETRSSQRSEAS
jgi:hypothetical protein